MAEVLVFRGLTDHRYKIYKTALENFGLSVRFIKPQNFNSKIHRLLKNTDGIVLAGGGDISTRLFAPDEPIHPGVKLVNEERDLLEREVVRYVAEADIPVLGICRGMQVMNWALGGDLYQDIDSQFPPPGKEKFHQQRDRKIPRYKPTHVVNLRRDSLIYRATGKDVIRVNSTHHQAVRKIAPGLKITGIAPDGIVEVLEFPGKKFFLGVQFHPEQMWRRYRDMRRIFEEFASSLS